MVVAGERWLGVRLDLLTLLLDGAVAVAAVLASQDTGRYKQKNYSRTGSPFASVHTFYASRDDLRNEGFLGTVPSNNN